MSATSIAVPTGPGARPRFAGGRMPGRPDAGAASSPREEAGRGRRRHVHSACVDFLTLGGGSLVVMGALAAFWPRDDAARAALASTALVLAFFLTYPHVAHSYQIFYRDFMAKAFAPDSVLASRYRLAGVLVPAFMAVFFAFVLLQGDVALLGIAGNVTLLASGWHYAKQGFGILMLDAARKRVRFSARERRRLLWNTHLVWVTFWLLINDTLAPQEMWGITYYLIDVPEFLRSAMLGLVAVSALAVGCDLLRKWRTEGALPFNGLVAYAATVYAWVLIGRFDPVLLLVVPLFHAIQYLSVVWRYRLNVEEAEANARPPAAHRAASRFRSPWVGLARFAVAGAVLGAAGFWGAPAAADALAHYDRAVFGATLFFFIAWTFVGIHHAVMDNVIWRRENPESRRYLFEA